MDIFKTDSPSKVFIDGVPYSLDELVCEIQTLKKKKDKLGSLSNEEEKKHFNALQKAKQTFLCASPSVFLK